MDARTVVAKNAARRTPLVRVDATTGTGARAPDAAAAPRSRQRQRAAAAPVRRRDPALDAIADRLSELEKARRDGTLALPDGRSLDVTNLAKVFWPSEGLTKGDLLRYYVRASPWLLPAVADRPLVMKRFPNGVKGKAFYQQRAPDEAPSGIRIDRIADDGEPDGSMPRLDRRLAADAALHDAARRDVAGPLVLARAVARTRRLRRARSRSRCRACRSSRCWTSPVGSTTRSNRSASPPFRRRRDRRACTSTFRCRATRRTSRACCSVRFSRRWSRSSIPAGDRGAIGGQARSHGLRRLSAEHRGQDARDRLQRPRERVRRRLDAAHVGRDPGGRRARGLHDSHRHCRGSSSCRICGRRCSKARRSICTACWSGWPVTPRVDRSRLGRHCDWSARPGSRAAARLAGM